jgi:hypothetical protein
VVADNTTDNRAAIQAAFDLGGAWKLPATTGTYLVNGELNVTVAGTKLDATGAPIRQGTNGMALFNIAVPDVTIDAQHHGHDRRVGNVDHRLTLDCHQRVQGR